MLLRAHVNLLSLGEGLPQTALEAVPGEVLSSLEGKGILSTKMPLRAAGDDRYQPLRPAREIVPRPPFREHIGARHAALYIASVISAKTALRMRSLHGIVLRERRRTIAPSAVERTFDPVRASLLCSAYSRLRVIATGPGQCLFDSLALKLFLAKYGLFPQWVFGVRLNPFSAHCWLQHGETLVNDSLDFVGRFTPIMTA